MAMNRVIWWIRLHSGFTKIILLLAGIVLVYVFYIVNHESNFSSINERYHQSQKPAEKHKHVQFDENETLLSVSRGSKETNINVMITLMKAEHNYNLQEKFRTTVKSMFRFLTVPVNLHILGDEQSERIATRILAEVADKSLYTLVHKNLEELAKEVIDTISGLQRFFSYKPGAIYSDALFFLSIVCHRVLKDLEKVIILDADLKFNADIKTLYDLFDKFKEDNIIGIAREMQPVYRHAFYQYRKQEKETKVGEPPPDGLTGFNSGVMLLDLEKMRKSNLYNSYLREDLVKSLTQKYMFKGHLGDQDFFTLISFEHKELFYILPCTWNRQLCQWWKNNGYANVFSQYFTCEGHINIYHGNCNTEIPVLEWER